MALPLALEIAKVAAPAATSLLGSLFSGITGRKSVQDTNAQNLQIARENNQMQRDIAAANNRMQLDAMRENNAFNRNMALEMFNLENAYNSPANQRKLLIEGGFNPATFYGQSGVVGQSDASTPTASSSGISPSMPSMVTPTMQAPPTVLGAMFQGLESASRIMSNVSSSGLNDAQKNRINLTINAELDKLLSEADNERASAAWTKFQTQLEEMFGKEKRSRENTKLYQEIYDLYADAALKASQGDNAKADAALKRAESALKRFELKQGRAMLPIVIKQGEETVNLLGEQQKTEKSKQALNYANTSQSESVAKLTDVQRKNLENISEDIHHINHAEGEIKRYEALKLKETWWKQVDYISGMNVVQQEELRKIAEEADRIAKDNDAYWVKFAFDRLEQTLKSAAAFIPLTNPSGAGSSNYYTPLWSTSTSR